MSDDAYGNALARAELIRAREAQDPRIAPQSLSQAMVHGTRTERAVLLLHGYTSSPPQFDAIGTRLRELGYSVVIPRYPHHGYRDRLTRDIANLTVEDCCATTLEAYEIAAGLGERVDVIGLSAGATFGAWLAQRRPVARTLLLAPLLAINHAGPPLDGLLDALLCRWDAMLWWDPIQREKMPPATAYPKFSTRALGVCLRVGRLVLAGAAQAAPVATDRITAVLNAREPAVDNRTARLLIERWQEHGADAGVHVLEYLPARHDFIEPLAPDQPVARVTAEIVELLAARSARS